MRQVFLLLLILTILVNSCTRTNSSPIIPNGTYSGIFQRQTSTGGEISNVTITFSDNTWIGQSEFAKYPALCHGTYKIIDKDKITFANDCAWTAEFDWTLILGQDYKIKTDNGYIEISKDYNNDIKDVYKLTKK